jgi:hypothetical protein
VLGGSLLEAVAEAAKFATFWRRNSAFIRLFELRTHFEPVNKAVGSFAVQPNQ